MASLWISFCNTNNGTIRFGRMVDEIGAHVKNMNKNAVGVCYIGGVEKDGKTPKDTAIEQKYAELVV